MSAEVYFGVAGATIPFYITKDSGPTAPARTDVVMRLTKDKQLPLRHLDEDDIRWQIAQRVVALVSTKRAVVNLTELIRRHCVAKALPKPR